MTKTTKTTKPTHWIKEKLAAEQARIDDMARAYEAELRKQAKTMSGGK